MPGYDRPYTFASGVTLTSPVPNADEVVLIGDLSVSEEATWELGVYGKVNREHLPPSGTSYFGVNIDLDATATLSFATDVYTVGAYVDGYDHNSKIAAYDANGKLISAAAIENVIVDAWGNNYVQVMSKVPIAKVVFTGDYIVIDDLTFDTAKPLILEGTGADDRLGTGHSGRSATSSDNAELIFGRGGDDKIKAQGGDDTADGGKGTDKVHGGDGNDTLIASKGGDRLWGDAGQDSFLFKSLGAAAAKIMDFNPADDTILLAQSAFQQLDYGSLSAAEFRLGATATDADDRIIYDQASGTVRYDGDGNGAMDAVVLARLTPGVVLSTYDFAVV